MPSTLLADDSPAQKPTYHHGRRLDEELQKPVNMTLSRTTPRAAVERLRELHQIALLLDRRIDPDRTVDVQLVQVTLGEGLELLAAQLDGELARVGSTLYIGPTETTDRIRTLIALRSEEVRALQGDDAVHRRLELLNEATLDWPDLAEPQQLLEEVARSFHVERPPDGSLPHDLWGGGMLVDVNAPEALSLLLGQFDLTFAWREQGTSLEIVPVPDVVTVGQSHTPRGMTAAEAIVQIRTRWPHLTPHAAGRTIVVDATAREHDDISALIAPDPASRKSSPDPAPLSVRRFTLTARRAEANAVIRQLENQGITIAYDRDALEQAGIDLRQIVTLELDKANAEELFTALCEPLGLTYIIESDEQRLVRLTPRQPSPP